MAKVPEELSDLLGLSEQAEIWLETLLIRSGHNNYRDLLRDSLALLKWSIEQVEVGRRIGFLETNPTEKGGFRFQPPKMTLPTFAHIVAMRKEVEGEKD